MLRKLCGALVLAALLLTGCSGPTGSVEELLCAPRTGEEQSAITDVLTAASGGTIKLKYPRSGSYLSPFVFTDVDSDGTEEAVVFYADETVSKNVRVALLDKSADGWQMVSDFEGLGTDIDAVELSNFYEDDVVSLLVGYTSVNLSEKHLAVYNCREGGLTSLYDQGYSQYVIADFTASGRDDLVVASAETQPGPAQLSLVTVNSGAVATVSTVTLDSRLQSCTGLYARGGRGAALFVDGLSGAGAATDVLHYAEGRLTSYSFSVGCDVVQTTGREQAVLKCRDADGDGSVEAPVVLGTVRDTDASVRWLWVAYYDFSSIENYQDNFSQTASGGSGVIDSILPELSATPRPPLTLAPSEAESAGSEPASSPAPTPEPAPTNERLFGLVDLKFDCFIPLPAEWKNQVQLRSLSERDWCVVPADGSAERLLVLQAVPAGESLASSTVLYGKKESYTQMGTAAGCRLYLKVAEESGAEIDALLANAAILS